MATTASPRVSRLSVTAVKGLGVVHPDAVDLTPTGVAGDRTFYLVDAADALRSAFRTGAWLGHTAAYDASADSLSVTCPDGSRVAGEVRLGEPLVADFYRYKKVEGRVVEGPWAELFSSAAGEPVRLVRADADNGGLDVRPVTLLGDASVAELARHAGLDDVDPRRFRMLVDISGTEPHAEDTWAGRRLRIGETVVRVEGPVKRCGAVNLDPDVGSADLPVLPVIMRYRGFGQTVLGRGVTFGVYAEVLRPGRIRVGDELELDAV
ncbi:MAG: hypothetical protein QOK35_2829 [Pseudonocardiales bacterium]|nr:hypothetical protein [Pseudonocardiales bacterium]